MLYLINKIPLIVRRIIFVIYFSGIILASVLPSRDIPKVELFAGADKLIHFLMYLGLSFLVLWSSVIKPGKKSAVIVFICLSLFGYILEFIQLEMKAGRTFSIWDGLANMAGIITGIFFYFLFFKKSI